MISPAQTDTNKSSHSDTFIKVTEAAYILGISPHTLRRYSESGEISTTKLSNGHRVFVSKETI